MMQLNFDQLASLMRSLLKILGAYLVTKGMTNAAGIVNGEDCAGVLIGFAGLLWSHWEHSPDVPTAPPPTTPSSGASKTLPVWFIIGGLVAFLALVGCGSTPQTVAYKTIGSLEQGATSSYDAYCGLVIRGALPTNGLPAASQAFQHFQDSARVAVTTAMNGTNALAPASLVTEETALVSLINGFVTSTNH